jgi:hypothetical protein
MGSMRRFRSGVVALLCTVLLSSCALVPLGHGGGVFDSDFGKADARMEQIGAAINSHDAAALKAVFSKRAVEKATDLDARLNQLLSMFPDGITWERDAIDSNGGIDGAKKTVVLQANYKIFAGEEEYWLFFADFTVNQIYPDNVGVYGLGVTPWFDGQAYGPGEAQGYWAGSILYDEGDQEGYPGVFVGYDDSQLARHKVAEIVDKVNIEDDLGLEEKFTKRAEADFKNEIHDGVDKLYELFPGGAITLPEDQGVVPVVRETTDDTGGKTTLLLSTYRVSSATTDYRLSFAYFTENTADPSNLGIYAIGIAPWTDSGDSTAEKALSSWIDKFDVDARTPPGVWVAK